MEKEIAFRAKKADPSPHNCRMFAERRAEFKEMANVKYREYLSSLIDNFNFNFNFKTILKGVGRLLRR